MSEVTAVNKTVSVNWRGKEYVLARANFLTEGAYCGYLEKRAFAALARSRAELGGDAGYKEAVAAVAADMSAGVYEWMMPLWEKSLQSGSNFKELLWLVMGQTDKSIRRATLDEMWKDIRDELVGAWNELLAPTPTMPPQEGEAAQP